MIEPTDDFRDLLIELADAGVEFVVVGGHAAAFHGHPRVTKDLDVLVRANRANAGRVYRALAAFGLDALLRNRKATKRRQDQADVEALEALRRP